MNDATRHRLAADRHGTASEAGPASPRTPSLYSVPIRPVRSQAVTSRDRRCPVCGEAEVAVRLAVVGTRFQVVQCSGCRLGMLDPLPSSEEIAAFYPQAYYGHGGKKFTGLMEGVVRVVGARQARFLARRARPGSRILDVGCGRGVLLNRLARAGFEMHGFEVIPEAVTGVDPRIQVRIAPSLRQAAYPQQHFDEVILWHVLEHVPDPREVLLEAHRILKPDGALIVAVPNFSSLQARWAGSAWFHLDLPRHLYHFPVAALRSLLRSCGFTCRSEHHFSLRQNVFGWVQSALNRIGWLPRNGLYDLLQRRPRQEPPPFRTRVRLQLWTGLCLAAPLALVLSAFEAAVRQGATVHIVAGRVDRDAPDATQFA